MRGMEKVGVFLKRVLAGFSVSFYVFLVAVFFIGSVGGFFVGQIFFSSAQEKEKVIAQEFSIKDKPSPLLASISEVFQRSFGESSRYLDAEVSLAPVNSSESIIDSVKGTSSLNGASSTESFLLLKKENEKKSVSETVVSCLASSTSVLSREVVINELAWMGSVAQSSEDSSAASRREWIELLNISSRTISLANWRLEDTNGKFKIIFPHGAVLRAGDFYLLARGSGEKILGNKPNLIYSAPLSNEGMRIKLFNDQCAVVDEVGDVRGWPAGNRETKQTMERDDDLMGWHTSVSPGGTPRAENSEIISISASADQTPSVISHMSKSSESNPPNATYPKLIITEVQTASVSTTRDEFVEVYNSSDQVVELTDWYLQKKTKSGVSYTSFAPKGVFAGQRILPRGFFVIAHPSSSFLYSVSTEEGLADDNTLVLKNPNGEVVDKVGWGGASDSEGLAIGNPGPSESIQRKFSGGTYVDTDSNINDFEFQDCPSLGKMIESCSSLAILLVEDIVSSTVSESASSSSETGATSTDQIDNNFSSSTIDFASSTESVAPSSTIESSSTSFLDISSSTTNTSSTAESSTISSFVDHLVISQIQITGGAGNAENDFIEIFNPTSSTIDMSGWKLRKRTQSGTESSIKVFSNGGSISSLGIFRWANSKDGFSEAIGAQASSTQTISNDSSIGLFDVIGNLIDAVAWGSGHTNPFVEGEVFGTNPGDKQILRRNYLDGVIVDTNDNKKDFSLEN